MLISDTVPFYCSSSPKAIPVLDRKYLRTGGSTAGSTCSIVRLIGFVQDQLDPEYYQTQVNGRSTKYRDYVYNGDVNVNSNSCGDTGVQFDPMGLAERQPLVVVPLPFSTPWFREGLRSRQSGIAAAVEEQPEKEMEKDNSSSSNNKRARDDGVDNAAEGKDSSNMQVESTTEVTYPARKVHQSNINTADNTNDSRINEEEANNRDGKNLDATSSPNCVTSTPNHLDWWPAGTMGSDESEVPVLAKMYYDDDDAENNDEGSRLRLNDVVEMVGIVHFDPMEADFSGQSQPKKKAGGSSSEACGLDGDTFLSDSFDDLSLGDRCSLPPPSLLPRLHVLCYNRIDLDETARRIAFEGNASDAEMMSEFSGDDASADDDRAFAIKALSDHLFGGIQSAGEALLMALMSMAERESSPNLTPGKPMQTPSSSTLGCASLNIVLPTAQACDNLKVRLQATLRQIVPVAACADLTLGSMAAGNAEATASSPSQTVPIGSPTKTAEGRLAPSIIQLPKGASLLINESTLAEGTIDEHGRRTLLALSSLTQHHTVPYRFDSMMDYQFEGDYRVIVLSEGTGKNGQGGRTNGEKLLGCTMKVRLSAPQYEGGTDQTLPLEAAQRIRSYIAIYLR